MLDKFDILLEKEIKTLRDEKAHRKTIMNGTSRYEVILKYVRTPV